LPFLV
ncbi:tRNA threonylcarbamoyladenosine dehydratase, partial [Haemophilus influenzae]